MSYTYQKGDVIAALHTKLTSHLLAFGINPAGAVKGDLVQDFLPHVADPLYGAGTIKLGYASEVDMVALQRLQPRLILADNRNASGEKLEMLRKIAPVKVVDVSRGSWMEQLIELGTYFSLIEQATGYIQRYQKKRDLVKNMLNDSFDNHICSVAFRIVGEELRVMGADKPIGCLIYDELGMQPAHAVNAMDEGPYQVIEPEELYKYDDANLIWMIIFNDDSSKKYFNSLLQHPTWSSLQAVRNNRFCILNGQSWLDYSSMGHDTALDEIQEHFAKNEQE